MHAHCLRADQTDTSSSAAQPSGDRKMENAEPIRRQATDREGITSISFEPFRFVCLVWPRFTLSHSMFFCLFVAMSRALYGCLTHGRAAAPLPAAAVRSALRHSYMRWIGKEGRGGWDGMGGVGGWDGMDVR